MREIPWHPLTNDPNVDVVGWGDRAITHNRPSTRALECIGHKYTLWQQDPNRRTWSQVGCTASELTVLACLVHYQHPDFTA
jgi:hypothetical protein